MLAAGLLWIALTGACTLSLLGEEYLAGTWPIGAFINAYGLFPVLFGWRRLERRLAVRRLLAGAAALVGLALTAVLLAVVVVSREIGSLLPFSPLIAVNLALAWQGVRRAREPRVDAADVFS